MILTCPQCSTRYLLPAQALAPEGRKVKCTYCEEVWFQLPDPDELAEFGTQAPEEDDYGTSAPETDIPEGVKPLPESAYMPALPDEVIIPTRLSTIGGYLAAACVGLALFGALLTFKESVAEAWPASRSFYEMVGSEIPVPGEGLAFDQVAARAAKDEFGREVIILEGQIINLTSKPQAIPLIQATLKSENGQVLESWYADPPAKRLDGEKKVGFRTGRQTNAGAENVSVKFVLKPGAGARLRTVLTGDDNSPAQHPDG